MRSISSKGARDCPGYSFLRFQAAVRVTEAPHAALPDLRSGLRPAPGLPARNRNRPRSVPRAQSQTRLQLHLGGRLVAVAVLGPDQLRDQARYRQYRRRCGLPVTAKRLPERPIDPRTSLRIHGLRRKCLSGSRACFDRPCGDYKQEMDRRSRSAVASIPNVPICSRRVMLGRSQVVRQRVLIPSCAGSIPAAPANAFSSEVLQHV